MTQAWTREDDRKRAVDLAYRALARRERTIVEMQVYLERKRVEPDAIEHAISALQDAGVLDDARFAERFAEDKRTLERWGSERIALDLRRRGVSAPLIEAVVASQEQSVELDAALELLAERMPGPIHDDRTRDRGWRLLVRKGYAPELAYEAVRAHERERAI